MSGDSLTQDVQAMNIFCTPPLHNELAILGGQTRVLSRKTKHRISRSFTSASSSEVNASSYASATSSTQQTTISTSSSRDMEEIYRNFAGYPADLSVANIPRPPGAVSSHYQSPTHVNQTSEFQQLNSDTFAPLDINQVSDTLGQQLTYSPFNEFTASVDAYSMDVSSLMAPVPMRMDEVSYQRQIDSFNFQDHTASCPESNYFLGAAPFTQYQDPADHLVEMGLTSESGMDEGWLSFMQECGIMD